MRVVFDTNVIVSAVAFGGSPKQAIDLARHLNVEWYISPFILEELDTVLARKFRWPKSKRLALARLIRKRAILMPIRDVPRVIKQNRGDNRVLACAQAAQAHFLVTGDTKHLLPLKKWGHAVIVSPSEFLSRIAE